MMKQLIHKAKTLFVHADGPGGTRVPQLASYLQGEPLDQFVMTRQMSADQQRIRWLEIQNRQLQADVAQWKSFSICFARDMRESLKD